MRIIRNGIILKSSNRSVGMFIIILILFLSEFTFCHLVKWRRNGIRGRMLHENNHFENSRTELIKSMQLMNFLVWWRCNIFLAWVTSGSIIIIITQNLQSCFFSVNLKEWIKWYSAFASAIRLFVQKYGKCELYSFGIKMNCNRFFCNCISIAHLS